MQQARRRDRPRACSFSSFLGCAKGVRPVEARFYEAVELSRRRLPASIRVPPTMIAPPPIPAGRMTFDPVKASAWACAVGVAAGVGSVEGCPPAVFGVDVWQPV